MACHHSAATIGLAAAQGSGLPHASPRGRRSTNESDLSHSSSSGRGGDGEGTVVMKAVTTGRRAVSRRTTDSLEGGTCMSSARVDVAGSGHFSFEADGWMNGVKVEAVGSRSGRGGLHGMRLRRVAGGGSGDGGDGGDCFRSRPRCYQAEATATSDANATMTESHRPRVGGARQGQGVDEREQGLPRADQSQVRMAHSRF